MPHTEEAAFQSEEYGTCNISFSFPDKPGISTTKDISTCTGPPSPRTAAVTENPSTLPTESVQSHVILNNNASTPTKISCSSSNCTPPRQDVGPTHVVDTDRLPKENADLPCDMAPVPSEEHSNTGLDPTTKEETQPAPLKEQDSQTTTNSNLVESSPIPASPSSNEMTSSKMDNPLPKPNEQTVSLSLAVSPPLPRETGTPPPTAEHGPLKATLVHIDTSPTDTPRDSPEATGQSLNAEADQPFTSLDNGDPSESERVAADVESPSLDRSPSTNSGHTLDRYGEEDEEGFQGDDDVAKNIEGEKLPGSQCLL